MVQKAHNYDVAIIGGGLAGLTMACLLGRHKIKTACIDQADPAKQIGGDLRTTAISYGSSKILEDAGIWQNLENKKCPIEDIRILDGASPLLLNFLSGEVEDKAFGWIVLNSDLRQAMMDQLQTLKSVTHIPEAQVNDILPSPDLNYVRYNRMGREDKIGANLIIGADGRGSFTRSWMQAQGYLRTRRKDYRQRAVICTVSHENPHHNKAVEHFWPEGPFAVLPMQDDENVVHRSSVVFTEHGPDSESLMHFSDKEFETALAARFPPEYGAVRLAGPRAAYPLTLSHASNYIGPRMALIADAAHGIHPIAGQGLNLGFRDVKALADLLAGAQDCGAQDILEAYQRARRFDNMSMVAVTDGLVRLFSNKIPPVRALRRLGLSAVSRLAPAKQFFMRRAMGE